MPSTKQVTSGSRVTSDFRKHNTKLLSCACPVCVLECFHGKMSENRSARAHHVTQRGNRRMQTFFCDEDYQQYLSLLSH